MRRVQGATAVCLGHGLAGRRLRAVILQNPPSSLDRERSRRVMRRQRGLVLPGGLDGRIHVVRSRRLESTPCGSNCSREVKESRQKSKPSSSSLHPHRRKRGGPVASRRRQHRGSRGASRAPAPGRGGQSRAAPARKSWAKPARKS